MVSFYFIYPVESWHFSYRRRPFYTRNHDWFKWRDWLTCKTLDFCFDNIIYNSRFGIFIDGTKNFLISKLWWSIFFALIYENKILGLKYSPIVVDEFLTYLVDDFDGMIFMQYAILSKCFFFNSGKNENYGNVFGPIIIYFYWY